MREGDKEDGTSPYYSPLLPYLPLLPTPYSLITDSPNFAIYLVAIEKKLLSTTDCHTLALILFKMRKGK